MFYFGKASKNRLSTCHNDWRVISNIVIRYIDFTVVCGHRDEEEQNKAFYEGKSKLIWPISKHNKSPSMAIDVAPYRDGRIIWGETPQELSEICMFAGFYLGVAKMLYDDGKIKHQVRWGGDWNGDNRHDEKFMDRVHFEFI